MSLPKPNTGKNISIKAGELEIFRYPIVTKVIVKDDDIAQEIALKTKSTLIEITQKNKVIVVSEKAVASSQGRAYPIDEIKPSKLARFLSSFVTKTPYGIGLGIPETMHLAIQEVGIPRILLAFIAAALTKPFGIKGVFYNVAGPKARGIDGPTPYTLPPYNKYAVLAPKDPDKEAEKISKKLEGIGVAIIDANDLGQNILGSFNLDQTGLDVVLKAFKDNPLGQSDQQTPVAIVSW